MIRRIAITIAVAFALGGCASYDAGYRQGYADSGYRRAPAAAGGVVVDYDDDYSYYDYARNGFYGGYGYPYEFSGYAVGFPWQFGFGPWWYQPWYGYGYPYGWHHWHHHHHGSGTPHVAAANTVPRRNRQVRDATAPTNAPTRADGAISRDPPDPVRLGAPFRERGFDNELREPRRPSGPHSRRNGP